MDNTDWDLMASVWVSIDRTQHCLSNYVAPDHPDYVKNKDTRIGKKVADIFRQTDDAIGSFVSRAREDDLILFISDHGFQSCTRAVNMDRMLHEMGFLEFSAPPTPCSVRCSGGPCARWRARSTTRWACTGRSPCRSR